MGSLISVGENVNHCGCNKGNLSAFTISEEALIKLKQPPVDEDSGGFTYLMDEITKGLQTDGYLKTMRCVQNEHSKKFGLTIDSVEDLLGSLSVYTRSVNHAGSEEEKNVVKCLKQKNDLIECDEPITKYVKVVDKHAKNIAQKNSKEVKVDSSIFSRMKAEKQPCVEEVEVIKQKSGTECKCDSDRGPSAFTISDKALEKIKRKTSSSAGELTAKEEVLSGLENKWLIKEKCVDEAHAQKWKYTKEDFEEIERRVLKYFELLQACPAEKNVLECYKNEKEGINCRDIVSEYVTCIEKFVKKTIARTGAVSCVKARPKTKLFSD